MKNFLRKLPSWFVKWFLDPVVFLTFLGPLVIATALIFIQGDTLLSVDQNGTEELRNLFSQGSLPGLVDYTVQYYTLLLVSVFWFRSCYEKGLIDQLLKMLHQENNDKKREAPEGSSMNWQLQWLSATGAIIFFALIIALMVRFFASPEILSIYVNHTPQLGAISWPPLESRITWARGIVFIHGFLIILYYNRKKKLANKING